MLWKQSFVLVAVLASSAFSAPQTLRKIPSSEESTTGASGGVASKRAPEPKDLTCTPNNQGVNVCCDQFGGCAFQDDLLTRAAKPKNLNCTPNNQGDIVCCDEFGGCAFQDDLLTRAIEP